MISLVDTVPQEYIGKTLPVVGFLKDSDTKNIVK